MTAAACVKQHAAAASVRRPPSRRRRPLRLWSVAVLSVPILLGRAQGLIADLPLGIVGRRISPAVPMLAAMWRWVAGVLMLALVLAVTGVGLARLSRPVPSVSLVAAHAPEQFASRHVGLTWPATGEAAVIVSGVGVLGSRRADRVVPIASVAKVMTAYVVLRDHPLGRDDRGPLITVTPADVAIYRGDLAAGESVARVKAGQGLSERQALEAMLLPSANNIATLLARWDAGSLEAFVTKMNHQARTLGLEHTSYADASGVDSATVSSANDQARLATAALRKRVFAQIVSMRQAWVPVAGVVGNLNPLLGRSGVFGVKTGSTSAAGGCLVFASHERVGAHLITVVGAVLGQPTAPTLPAALEAVVHASTRLLRSIPRVFEIVKFDPNTPLASLRAPWTHPVAAGLSRGVSFVAWPHLPVHVRIEANPNLRAPLRTGQPVAMAQIVVGEQHETVPILATRELASPSFWWRVTHS